MSRRSSSQRHTTYAGRIVYDRPRHNFGARDANRILNRINLFDQSTQDLLALSATTTLFLAGLWTHILLNTAEGIANATPIFGQLVDLVNRMLQNTWFLPRDFVNWVKAQLGIK